MERAKNLALQVQTATFQKMEDDLQRDMKSLKDWSIQETERKRSWHSLVLTHKRKRYVKGLQAVRDLCSASFRIKNVDVAAAEMELASFRCAADAAAQVQPEKKLFGNNVSTLLSFKCTFLFELLVGINLARSLPMNSIWFRLRFGKISSNLVK